MSWCFVIACVFLFFFFKQKTAYEMRISDWSSDVCSSDLTLIIYRPDLVAQRAKAEEENATRAVRKPSEPHTPKKQAAEGVTRSRRTETAKRSAQKADRPETHAPRAQIGRAHV